MSAYSSNHCVRSLDITNYPTAEQTLFCFIASPVSFFVSGLQFFFF